VAFVRRKADASLSNPVFKGLRTLKRFNYNMSATKSNPAQRINFGKVEFLAETPDLLGIQIQSFKDFFQLETTPDKRNVEGLFRVFKENFPITDTRNIFVLEFLDYFVDPPRYTIEECI